MNSHKDPDVNTKKNVIAKTKIDTPLVTNARPLVSVIVPVYNVSEYIVECLTSILSQTYTNLEILIINDGTKDDSIIKISNLVEQHPTIRVITQENQGLSGARNTGINAATGDYVVFIDSDDKIKPTFVQNLVTHAVAKKADIVRASFRDFDGEIPSGWQPDLELPAICSGLNALSTLLDCSTSFVVWSSIYRLEFLNKNSLRFEPGILLEDGDFTTRAYLKAKHVASLPDTDYCYRVRPGSILTSGNNAGKMSRSESLVVHKFLTLLRDTPYHHLSEKQVLCQAIYAFLRDWTRILATNTINSNEIDAEDLQRLRKAVKVTKSVVATRTNAERLKFAIKLALIKVKYRHIKNSTI